MSGAEKGKAEALRRFPELQQAADRHPVDVASAKAHAEDGAEERARYNVARLARTTEMQREMHHRRSEGVR